MNRSLVLPRFTEMVLNAATDGNVRDIRFFSSTDERLLNTVVINPGASEQVVNHQPVSRLL